MFNNKKSFKDTFFPQKRDNVKKVVVLSALTGAISAAVTNFFSKKENRTQARQKLDKLGEEARVARDRFYDKAQDVASDIADTIKIKARDVGNHIQDINVKKTNSSTTKTNQKPTITLDVEVKK